MLSLEIEFNALKRPGHRLGIVFPDLIGMIRSPKTAAAVYGFINRAWSIGSCHGHFDPRTDRGTVGFDPFQLERNPMVAIAGIQKQSAPGAVASVGAAQDDKHVLIAIIVEIGKSHGVSLLQVPEAAGGRYILEELPRQARRWRG